MSSDDRYLSHIVSLGIIPVIQEIINSDNTVDSKIAEIRSYIDRYDDFFHTGRKPH